MNATYYEGRLKAAVTMMDAATDPCARTAHRGLVEGYRRLVTAARLMRAERDIDHAIAQWADDGGPSWSTQ